MKHGFSLVELSIVLVILGLLTGGILAGQSLIRASELRAVTSEFQRYSAAAYTFRDKYFAIPGDMNNATKFWGDDNAACADAGVPNGTPGTCNGDADGILEDGAGPSVTSEKAQFWKQLALAGLVEGTYTGLAGPGGLQHMVIGTNIPRSKLGNAGWSTSYWNAVGVVDAIHFGVNYGNHFVFGGQHVSGAPTEVVLRPEETWNIDTKMDDGMPGLGKFIAARWAICTNAADGADINTTYKLNSSAIACGMRIIGGI